MKYFEHHFDNVEDYLHHRPPYLMVDRIDSIHPRSIETASTVKPDASFLAGHFPGAPILPGAMMQEMSTQSAGILIASKFNPMERFDTHDPLFNEYAIGVLVRVKNARFRGFARPGDELRISVGLQEIVGTVFEFTAQIRCDESTIMRNRFQLTNLPSTTLRGRTDHI
jgi:3-hydroxyacyl-[acyl-carrier-protein] dehydratase